MAEDIIVNCGMPYTIFRPSWFMESLKFFVRGNSLSIIGKQQNPLGWVAAEDYARMVSAAYKTDDAKNKKFFIYRGKKRSSGGTMERWRLSFSFLAAK